jgi:pyrophosphate--fructose-6-phosphate 1-phosphotransferase
MVSILQKLRLQYQPVIPDCLMQLSRVALRAETAPAIVSPSIRKLFPCTCDLHAWSVEWRNSLSRPLNVGVLFSGGQAAGGHNVICGLFDGIMQIDPRSKLIGFLNGPSGLIDGRHQNITASMVDGIRNQGGFDLLGSGRTKIETPSQFQVVAAQASLLKLDAIVIIGGDDSNTNAALLAEYFAQNKLAVSIIGVPKTIDGDLRSADIEISFGFDSAVKTYAELIGNIARDAVSAKKYIHFIKLMGRSASHIVLECALLTQPNLALIGEERQSLSEIVVNIANLILERKKAGKEYGVILLPEGLIEFVPECKELISACNQLLASGNLPEQIREKLAKPHSELFASLPSRIQDQLLLERDPHGNIQVSQIDTDVLIMHLVKQELKRRNSNCNGINHFFGYEGRSCFPSNFDANYCYALGRFAALVTRDRASGVILAIKHLHRPVSEWELKAAPIVRMMGFEVRHGKEKPVIIKTLVDLQAAPYRHFVNQRPRWRLQDAYQMPGPIQFLGSSELTDSSPMSLETHLTQSIGSLG